MTQLPLVLIPTFSVPSFLMLHLTALFLARRLHSPLSHLRNLVMCFRSA
jgi:hypothetical protein